MNNRSPEVAVAAKFCQTLADVRGGAGSSGRQSSQPAVRPSHVSCHGFDVTRDGIAQLKTYQCVSKSTPFRLDTSNKRLLKRHAHTINLSVCACQPRVTAGEGEKPADVRVLSTVNVTKSVCWTARRPSGEKTHMQTFIELKLTCFEKSDLLVSQAATQKCIPDMVWGKNFLSWVLVVTKHPACPWQ